MNSETIYLDFELTRGFDYEIRQSVTRRDVVSTRGTLFSWDEMVKVLNNLDLSSDFNVPGIITVDSFIGLKNLNTGVLKKFSTAEFNSSNASAKLKGFIKFFIVREKIPTVADIKRFINNCGGCGLRNFCETKFKLKDNEPAFFNMCCSPCIRPLKTDKHGGVPNLVFQDRLWTVDSQVSNFFNVPMNLQIVSPIIKIVSENSGVEK